MIIYACIITVISSHSAVFVLIGQRKLGRVITPDPWKTGARNTTGKFEYHEKSFENRIKNDHLIAVNGVHYK